MQKILFTVLFLATSVTNVFSQTTVSGEGSAFTSCYNGTFIEGVTGDGLDVTECDFSANSCQTKIESKENYLKVDRDCKQTEACLNNADGNDPKCYPGENGVRLCFFCCETDLCNDFTEIPELLISEEP